MDAESPTKPTCRRWLRFSLRSLLVVVTAMGIWLGFQAHAAREQREAVEAIFKAEGTTVTYDYQVVEDKSGGRSRLVVDRTRQPTAPVWLRQLIGEDYFRTVVGVHMKFHSENRRHDVDARNRVTRMRELQQFGIRIREGDLNEAQVFLKRLKDLPRLRRVGILIDLERSEERPYSENPAVLENWLTKTQPMQDFKVTISELRSALPHAEINCDYELHDVLGTLFPE